MEWKFYHITNYCLSSDGIRFDFIDNITLLIDTINKLTKHMDVSSL